MVEIALTAASPVIEMVVKKLASGLWKELGLARSVSTDIEKLQSKLSKIQDVLDDVERKPISKPLQGTLRKLRDVALDAEDVVEEFETEVLRRRMEGHDHMNGKVRDFCSSNNPIAFRCKMARKIKEIRDRIDEIVKDNKDLDSLVKSDSDSIKKKSELDRPVDRETTSLMVEPKIYGRDEDERKVMEFLVDRDNDKNISILTIVGLGGVGKTTLAQLVYNNERIKEQFELPMWVCVGKNFDVEMVLRAMIEQVKEEQRIFSTLQTMSTFLDEKLRAKRFLLILDDLWNDKEPEWEKLKPLFIHAKLGSKIIVTTRIETVASSGASTIGTVEVHKLQGLQDEDCWSLFEQRAFRFQRQEDNPELVEIGWEIIRKCGGLPLAAKALGSLMSSKRGKAEWLAIKNNEIWITKLSEDVVPVLKLSYDHLPSHLKRCFTYCSMFPKDHEFEIERLIQLWMAQGLIDTSGTSQNAEDIGKQYFDNLLWGSFFQVVEMDEYKNPVSCKMHDLVHDLACSITKDEALVMEGDTKSISHGCRYLLLTNASGSSVDLKAIYEAKKMRSIILLRKLNDSIIDEFIFNVTRSFTRLHALDLSWSTIQKLSDRISRLRHLRFLDLSWTKITTLPTSITRLYNLQTLNLQGCEMLEELPEGIDNLGNLRHLNITRCDKLSCMPRSLGQLSNLKTLPMFIVAEENGRTIVELQHLNSIRGRLEIKNLHHVKDPDEAMLANLRAKTKLNYLSLEWNEGLYEEQEPSSTEVEVAEGVFERLQPHPNLKQLEIHYYIGTRLPNWMSSSFPNLVELELWDLKRCEHLPLGPWPLLKYLYLCKLHAVRRIGEEFCGDGDGITFPSLEDLTLDDMPNLEIWHTQSCPRLTKLEISSCPKLAVQPCIPCSVETLRISSSSEMPLSARSLAGLSKLKTLKIVSCGISSSSGWWDGLQYLTTLEYLEIFHCDELTCLPEDIMYLPSLSTLRLMINENLRSLEGGGRKQQQPTPFFIALQYLQIGGADMLTTLPEWVGGLITLQKLQISNLPQLAMLPDGLRHLIALQELYISDLPELTMLPDSLQHLTALQKLHITELPQLAMLPDGLRHLIALQELHISDLPELTMLPDSLQHLTALQKLHITKLPLLAMLPDGLRHLTALQELRISDLSWLTMLPDSLQHLTALQKLYISNLPRLTMLPDSLQHLTALQTLYISNLPQLTMLPDSLQHLTALQILEITKCTQLAMLPNGLQHLTTLQYLAIQGCPQLVRRCKRETGEDWHKVAHIPHIFIEPEEENREEMNKRCTFAMKFLDQFGFARCAGHS